MPAPHRRRLPEVLSLSRTQPRAISNKSVGAGVGDGGGAGVLARELPRVHLSVGHWTLRTTTAAIMVGRIITLVPTMRTRITCVLAMPTRVIARAGTGPTIRVAERFLETTDAVILA